MIRWEPEPHDDEGAPLVVYLLGLLDGYAEAETEGNDDGCR